MDSYLYSSSHGLLYKAIDEVAKLSSAPPYQMSPIEPQRAPSAPLVFPSTPIREFSTSFTAPYFPNPLQMSRPTVEAPHTASPAVPTAGPARIDYSLSVQRQRAAMNRDRYRKVRFCVFCHSSKQPEQCTALTF